MLVLVRRSRPFYDCAQNRPLIERGISPSADVWAATLSGTHLRPASAHALAAASNPAPGLRGAGFRTPARVAS